MKVKGYASVFGNIDLYGEVVDAGAFAGWINSNPQKQVPLLWMHDRWTLPIGMTTAIHEDAFGLRFEAEIEDTALGVDVAKLIASGAVRSSSFAYKTIGEEMVDEIWHLTQLDLLEISAVTTGFGANEKATIEMAPDEQEPKSQVHPAPELSAADIDAIFAKYYRKD